MKACIVQPPYSTEYEKSDEYFRFYTEALDNLDESVDILVLPEACDAPCLTKTKEQGYQSYEKYGPVLLEKAAAAAKRCNAIVCVNLHYKLGEGKYRNSTCVFDREGNLVGRYDKQHLVPNESNPQKTALDAGYSFEYNEPYVLELEGLRFAFLTCYDFYFYEAFAAIARQNVDIIIGCSHQRSDRHDALEVMTRFCAYNTNAYILRASVSMGKDAELGGCSMVVAPDGKVLANMKSETGKIFVDFDPKAKYFKPAGYGNPPAAHYQYIEQGRRPYKYRPGGSMMVANDDQMPYPRVCSHRGFNSVAPENSLPAYGAAVALGAEEIEFDLWSTKDGYLVSCHDNHLGRLCGKDGYIADYTLEELKAFNFGYGAAEGFQGLQIATFEEILKKFSCTTIMNIHVKLWDCSDPEKWKMQEIIDFIRKYDCAQHIYFMSSTPAALKKAKELAPEMHCCMGAGGNAWAIVDRALEVGAEKVQLYKPYFNQEMIDKAHANGIKCNVFWSDDEEETKKFLDMGIDCILTNDYLKIANVVKAYQAAKK